MKPKHIPKHWQTFIWFAVIGITLSYCTAEGCEDCDTEPSVVITSFTYTPQTVFVGDTVTFFVEVNDTTINGLDYMWAADDGSFTVNVGKILDGVLDNEFNKNSDQLDWYKTTVPTNRWIATDTAIVTLAIKDRGLPRGTTINPINK
jgi:hypothetical protein